MCSYISLNCLWLVGVALIFDGILQKIVQRCQIAAARWPNDISSAADNAIFKNRAQNSKLPRFSSSIFVNKTSFNMARKQLPLTVTASPCSFSKKNSPIIPLDRYSHQTVIRVLCSKCDNFACLHTRQDQNELYLKR